ALGARLLLGGRRYREHPLRGAVHAVALAEARPLEGHGAVVVQGGAPEHAAVRHHALAVLQHLLRMATAGAAGDVGNAQVAGVDEAADLRRVVVEQGVGADGVGRGAPGVGEARGDVGPFLGDGTGVAAVAVAAAEATRLLEVRVAGTFVALQAAGALDAGGVG